jgi:hypothetical protein
MPTFDLVSVEEAMMKAATGKRAEINREYLGYIEQLRTGRAGRLQASEGETVGAIRRRLGSAAKLAGKSLMYKRTGDTVYFWVKRGAASPTGRRRGRPPKTVA